MNYANTLTNNYYTPAANLSGVKINLRLVNGLLTVALAIGFLSFLIINNNLAVQSFMLKDLKTQTLELNNQNKELEVKITTLNSYQYLSQKVAALQMVKADNALYLSADKLLARGTAF